MVLKVPKMAKMAKKGIRKVQKYHKHDKIGPNFALKSRRKMPKNEPNLCKRTNRAKRKIFLSDEEIVNGFTLKVTNDVMKMYEELEGNLDKYAKREKLLHTQTYLYRTNFEKPSMTKKRPPPFTTRQSYLG